MCGIAGLATWRPDTPLAARLTRMIATLTHRGPDDEGAWVDDAEGIALGHRRLAIIDVSPHGHQPMAAASGRYVIAYNGEIYNFQTLRQELEAASRAPAWRGHSDTEVLLAAFDAWGIEATLRKLTGMFAIALWDRETRTLTLARDRLGEKPLYYGHVAGVLVFGSELKAVAAAPGQRLAVSRDALAEYMRFGYVPAPHSIYEGVFKLPPGHLVVLDSAGALPASRPFWTLPSPRTAELKASLAGRGDTELVGLVHDTLSASVARQRVADVPLGAFLSGGVDSSLVAALMQSHSAQRVRTFTIGFDEGAFDEAPHAKAVAAHLGTEHTELYVTARNALDLIVDLPHVYDEPFADSSQIPTTLLSQLTRRHVTVSLSGDGGDELFAGYPRYWLTADLWNKTRARSPWVRKAAAAVLQSVSARTWDRTLSFAPARLRAGLSGQRLHRAGRMMAAASVADMYVQLMSRWQPEDRLVRGASPAPAATDGWPETDDAIEAMRLWDTHRYLPDDLLVKVDRATMSASLEARAPLLDHAVVETAFALPGRVLVRDGVGKWVLRQVLDRYVPRSLIERPKAGFEVPLAVWLRGPLREWAETLLAPAALASQGYLDERRVTAMWQEHLRGDFDRSLHLWHVLMFQAWLAAQDAR